MYMTGNTQPTAAAQGRKNAARTAVLPLFFCLLSFFRPRRMISLCNPEQQLDEQERVCVISFSLEIYEV